MSFRHFVFLFVIAVLFSCNQKNKQDNNTHTIKVVDAKGYLVPRDSITTPKTIIAGKLENVNVGNPKVVPANTNIHPAGIPKITLAGKPHICTLGKDTFSFPKIVPAIDSPLVAGIPEIVIAKDAYTKDQNPQSFISFKKLQGLKHGNITCLLEDKLGNLWFGTEGGGVSKYDGKNFTHFTNVEGLGSNVVTCMLEDRSGNLWFGTYGSGVSKYDGKNFTIYTEKRGLSSNDVRCILEDKTGNVWIGTGAGVSKYEGKSFIHFTQSEGLCNNDVRSLLEDKSGNIWIGTNGGGVSKYDGKNFTNFTQNEGLANNIIWSMLEDKSGNLWFGSYDGGVSKFGLSEVEGKTQQTFTHYTDKEGLSNNVITSMLEDKSGNIWFGTFAGASKYDGQNFIHFTDKEGLSNSDIRCMLEDKSGNLWLGTAGGGVSKYDGKYFTHFTDREGLSSSVVTSMCEDKSGNLWFGTYGGGVNKYNGKFFTHYTEKEGLGNNVVTSMMKDRSGNLWFATYGGGVSKLALGEVEGKMHHTFTHITEKEGLSNNVVLSLLEDKSGNFWFGTYGGGISKLTLGEVEGKMHHTFTYFTDKEGLNDNVVWSLLEDKSGNIWFSTNNGGVSMYNGKSFTHFKEKEGMSNNVVWSMLEDRSGNLWFGTSGGGVIKYDGKHFTHFTEKEGLCSNYVLSILEDKFGNLWFGTRFGLSKLTPAKLAAVSQVGTSDKLKSNNLKGTEVLFKNYTYEDGFLGIGCARNSICEDKSGVIWIGTSDRLTAYHPPAVEVADTIAPKVELTGISLFNESIAWVNLEKKKDSTLKLSNGVVLSNFEFDGVSPWYGLPKHLSLAYNNNYIAFSFIGITMNQPKKVKCQYKLEGIDEGWSASTQRTEAAYGNLPHGNYIFKVKAMNSEGYWSDEFNYSFVIRPPWWQTWWFRVLIGLLILGSAWYYIHWRERSLKEKQKELEIKINKATYEIKEQKELIEEKHKEITDSINYAERIQRSFMATKELLDENLKDYFVFFKPKGVVSGDFYWASKVVSSDGVENFILVTADSTGHGVPGAIMSLLNISSLEKAIENEIEPAEILNKTRKTIIDRLKKDGSKEGGKDGMDCSLINFNYRSNSLTYAAANNPIWIVRKGKLHEYNPDKMPVGKHDKDTISFTQHIIELQKEDVVYTFTDGMPDQFGGPKGKKFMYKQLKELFISIAPGPMETQKQKLKNVFDNWKGGLEQVDDVTIIGIRV